MLSIFLAAIEDHSYEGKFLEIYHTYEAFVFNSAMSFLKDFHAAEEATQDTFMGIAQNIASIDTSNEACVKVYVYITVRNKCLNILNRNNDSEVLNESVDIYPGEELNAEDSLIMLESNDLLKKAVLSLPTIYRDVLTYKYLLEMSVRDIAKLVHIPERTVRSRIRNGLKKLKKELEDTKV